MKNQTIQSNTHLSEILDFQDKLLNLVHTEIYAKNLPTSELILKFSINHISQISEKYNRMIQELTILLVDKRLNYELTLRDYFQKIFSLDFLPLLRINRYQLTKLSLFGFDIYIEPLEALLQILGRIDSIRKTISQMSEVKCGNSIQQSIEMGWESFILYSNYWKLSLNLYLLREYLRVGGKSFEKKDRQIIFTGCLNLYNQIIGMLVQKEKYNILVQFAELNNSLYNFHASFNYFYFFTLLLPLKDSYEPIFHSLYQIADKCLRTNIITPLLFGFLRNKQQFLLFIQQANSDIWLPYINTIIGAIVINLKFRILQFYQVLEIFESACNKAGLLGELRTFQVTQNISQWREAKDFFISAIKIGYNPGQVQTWKSIDFDEIEPRVMKSILNGLLLNLQIDVDSISSYLKKYEEKISEQITELLENRYEYQNFINSTISIDKKIENKKQLMHFLRILNLVDLYKIQNQNSINFLLECFLGLNINIPQYSIFKNQKISEKLNSLIFRIFDFKNDLVKDKVVLFHKKYKPKVNVEKIIDLYIKNFEIKKSLTCLLQILEGQLNEDNLNIFVSKIIESYITHPLQKLMRIKTFEKQFIIKHDYLNLNYQTHSVLAILTNFIINSSQSSLCILKKIIIICPWITLPLLNFPINTQQTLISFTGFLISKVQFHNFLLFLLQCSSGKIKTSSDEDFVMQVIIPNVCDQIIKTINEKDNPTQLYFYAKLLLQIFTKNLQIKVLQASYKQLLLIYLFMLQKSNQVVEVEHIVNDFNQLLPLVFENHLSSWLACLQINKIQGQGQFSFATVRKRAIKNIKDSMYFISEVENNDFKQPTQKYGSKQILQKLNSFQLQQMNSKLQSNLNLADTINLIKKQKYQDHKKLLSQQNLNILQDLKQIYIPEINKLLLAELLNNFEANKPNYEIVLNILSLNPANNKYLIESALSSQKIFFLNQCKLPISMSSTINQLLSLQNKTNSSFVPKIVSNLSEFEKNKIGEKFYIERNSLLLLIQNLDQYSFLVLFNNTNWRIIIEYFSKQLSIVNLPSLILQYEEYLRITNRINDEYEQKLSSFEKLFEKYIKIVLRKLQFAVSSSLNNEQLNLKSANEFSSLNVICSLVHLKEAMEKLSHLHKTMKERNIKNQHKLVSILSHFNQQINVLFSGDILLPDFLNGYYLTSDYIFIKNKVQIPIYLEDYYQNTVEQNSPSNIFSCQCKELSFKQLNSKNQNFENIYYVLKPEQPCEIIKAEYISLLERISNNVFQQQDILQIKKQKQKESQFTFYKLGCYQSYLKIQNQLKIPKIFLELVKRKKLSWETLKTLNTVAYHHIKSILAQNEINAKEYYFVHNGSELVSNGEKIRVNQFNRQIYCNKIALMQIGQYLLKCFLAFLKGYLYQNNQTQ